MPYENLKDPLAESAVIASVSVFSSSKLCLIVALHVYVDKSVNKKHNNQERGLIIEASVLTRKSVGAWFLLKTFSWAFVIFIGVEKSI